LVRKSLTCKYRAGLQTRPLEHWGKVFFAAAKVEEVNISRRCKKRVPYRVGIAKISSEIEELLGNHQMLSMLAHACAMIANALAYAEILLLHTWYI
jgi:hypothetical protein